MATKSIETGDSGHRRARAICAMAACILLGLGIWRGAEVFSQPADVQSQLSAEQQKLLHVIEPLTGAGNARVTVRKSGKKTRDFLVMIDASSGIAQSAPADIEAILINAAGFNAALGDTLTVRQLAFASGTSANPEAAELIELSVMGLLVFLLSWGAFAPTRQATETRLRSKNKRSPDNRPPRTRPVAVDLTETPNSKTVSAAKTATENPAETANVIRAWMRSSETQS